MLTGRARADARDAEGRTPLQSAAAACHAGSVRALLSQGGVERSRANRALRYCLLEGHGGMRPKARVAATLIRAGACLRSADLDSLLLHAPPEGATGLQGLRTEQEMARAGLRGVLSLAELSQLTLATTLSPDTLLPTLHTAILLDSRWLRTECERLVIQNFEVLREAGALAGASPRLFLERLLFNVLGRPRTFLHDAPHSTEDLVDLFGEATEWGVGSGEDSDSEGAASSEEEEEVSDALDECGGLSDGGCAEEECDAGLRDLGCDDGTTGDGREQDEQLLQAVINEGQARKEGTFPTSPLPAALPMPRATWLGSSNTEAHST